MLSYLTTPAPEFGTLAWGFFIGQILGVAAGAYLSFWHTERNPARQTFLRQLGYALMILGGIGVLFGALRLLNMPTLNTPLWFWVQAVVELAVAIYVIYYMRTVLPNLEREARARGIKAPATGRSGRSQSNGATEPAPPRPVATTSRRDARRERKRKK